MTGLATGVRAPAPLRPGDTIAVTAPSSGVADDLRPRLDAAVGWLEERGYRVRLGECLGADRVVSGTRQRRAAELVGFLRDPEVHAVVPPWGGELAIDLLDELPWDELAGLEPTWVVGYSDLTTLLLPLLTRCGWASIHGANLMETPYRQPEGLLHWTDVAAATGPLTQRSPGRYRAEGHDDWQGQPAIDTLTLPDEGGWQLVGGGGLDVTGRLVGGCVEVLSPLAGTPFGDVAAFGDEHAGEGLVVLVEVAEAGAYEAARALHGLRLAGWFEHATAVLVGRTSAPGEPDLSQHDAVRDALAGVDAPVLLDVEVGHTFPHAPLVLGAPTRVVVEPGRHEITQEPV